jgi:hypothetical protein
MSRRARDLLLGVALTVSAFAGALWQVDQSGALGDAGTRPAGTSEQHVSLPRLICPLH